MPYLLIFINNYFCHTFFNVSRRLSYTFTFFIGMFSYPALTRNKRKNKAKRHKTKKTAFQDVRSNANMTAKGRKCVYNQKVW